MIKIGTRKSRLALAQSKIVQKKIEELGFSAQLIKATSKGDQDLISPITAMRGSGIFTGTLERMLIQGSIDIAVHSLKDLALESSKELEIRAILSRHNPEDILLIREENLQEKHPFRLTQFSRIGTGSLRRQAQIKDWDPTAILVDIRGNIDTRIKQLQQGHLDGIIIAAAVFDRMEIKLPKGFMKLRLPLSQFPTAPGQGAIAVQTRKGEFQDLKKINDKITRTCVEIERELFAYFPGGCNNGVGLTVQKGLDEYTLDSFFLLEGINRIKLSASSENELKEKFRAWVKSRLPEDKPKLKGKVIVFTDETSGHKYVEKLGNAGLQVISLPVMEWKKDFSLLSDDRLLFYWREADWVVLTSKHSVPFLHKLKVVSPRSNFRTAVVGPATAEIMRNYGLPVHFVSKSGNEGIKTFLKKQEGNIIYLSGKYISDALREFEGRIERFQVYQTQLIDISLPFKPNFAVVFSSRSAKHLLSEIGSDAVDYWVAIGTKTAATLRKKGVEPLVATFPTPEGILETICRRKIECK